VGKRGIVTGVVALSLVAGFGFWLSNRWERVPLPRFGPDCTVEASGQVTLDYEQMANAATVAAVGVRLEMPDQAVVVALAAAFQESKLRNLPHLGAGNDHDSVGLFQQRPSQGWGDAEDIAEPRYAAERFYLALRAVDGWQEMRVTDAAQRVQRSAFPEAYEKWAGDANVLATALLGDEPGAVACAAPEEPAARDGEEAAAALGEAIAQDWGTQVTSADDGELAASVRLSAAESGPGVAVVVADTRAGWQYAHWLVAHAAGHGVTRVRFSNLQWTAIDGSWSSADSNVDHVHAEVAG
jgi:hypothetical protein